MSETIEREYPYRPDLYLLWAAPLFLGLMSGLALYFALTNDRPVALQGVLEFPATLANIGAGAAGILFALLFFGAVVLVVQTFAHPQRIALTATSLLVPKGFWSSAAQAIPYAEITRLSTKLGPDAKQTLTVHHQGGEYAIAESLLPAKADFEELCRLLSDRVAGRSESF